MKTKKFAGAAEKAFAERATLPTAGENMASWVEVEGYDDGVDEAQVGGLSGLAAGYHAPMFARSALALAHVTPAYMSPEHVGTHTNSREAADHTVSIFTRVS